MKIFFDDVCYDIYIGEELKFPNLGKYEFYNKSLELLTDEQQELFIQGEREFDYLK